MATDEQAPPGRLARFFLLERTFALLLTAICIAGGIFAYSSMVKESNPDIPIPQATVRVICPGMDPGTVEKDVVDVLEEELKTIAGVKKLRSASMLNQGVIGIEFFAELDVESSMAKLRAKVAEAEGKLPSSVRKPSVVQRTVDDRPILSVTLYGQLDDRLMGRVAKNLQERLQRVKGVREVNLAGRRDEVISVRLKPTPLDALGITTSQVADALKTANVDASWQRFESESLYAPFRMQGRFRSIEQIEQIPIKRFGDRVVVLKEIAEVTRTLEKAEVATAFSTGGGEFQPCVDVSIVKASGADTVETIKRLRAEIDLAARSSDWPASLEYGFTTDQSQTITDDLGAVFTNAWQAMLGVFIVLLIALSWREALVAAFCIPITFLGTLLILWMTGNTMNSLVIIGMVLALGMLVDVFILMMEGMHGGIYGRRESFDVAAIKTTKTFALPAFAGQMTTILAMLPLLFIAGFQGKFIRVIPTTTIFCLIASFTIAMLASIPLSSFLLRGVKVGDKVPLVDRICDRLGAWLEAFSLRSYLKSKAVAAATLALGVLMFVGSLKLAGTLPSELYPPGDERDLAITIELPPSASLETTSACADAVGEVLRQWDCFENVVKFSGQLSPMAMGTIASQLTPSRSASLAGFTCRFTHADEREELSLHYIAQVRTAVNEAVAKFPGAAARFVYSSGGGSSDDPLQIVLFGDDDAKLRAISHQVQRELAAHPNAMSVRDNVGRQQMQITAIPNRESLNFHQFTESALAEQVRYAMAPQTVGSYVAEGVDDNLDVQLSVAWASRTGDVGGPRTPQEMRQLSVISSDGESVPLKALLEVDFKTVPVVVAHEGARRAITVSSKTNGATVGEVLGVITPKLDELQKTWPVGYSYKIGGEAEDAAETFGSAAAMMVLAVFLVFALLLIQFNSLSQPFIIMFTVPLALIGTFCGFYVMGMSLSFPAFIGIISLVGIVVNNAIVMIDTMNTQVRAGSEARTAAAKGAAERMRPILSTTMTTLVGLVPLALSSPEWMPLCAAIICGLIAGTVSAFVFIPSAYYLLTKNKAS